MAGKEIDWDLLNELKCPVCLEYMSSPIKMCEKGHNICGSCKERLSECPSCRGTFINVRNIILENLAAAAIYPCKNKKAGCEKNLAMDDRNKHLSVCLYQSIKCLVGVMWGVNCSWTGIQLDLEAHLEDKHSWEIFIVPNNFTMLLYRLARGKSYPLPVFTLGQLFYVTLESEGDAFKFGVFHFGPKEESEAFKYGIKIGNSESYISVTRKCHSCLEGDPMNLQPEKYVKIYYDTILNFVDERGHLSCEFEIGREKLNGFLLEEARKSSYTVRVNPSDGHFWFTNCWHPLRAVQSHPS
jgi:E3 ubiquitin-protein ligase SIAH1